jgi:hypothetical protein
MSDLVEKLRKAADWGEDEFDVLSPQDAAAAADRIEALEAENFKLAAGACTVEGGLVGDEHGHVYCSLKARIEALERELAAMAWAERERCASIAENAMVMLEIGTPEDGPFTRDDRAVDTTRASIAAAIRNGERG